MRCIFCDNDAFRKQLCREHYDKIYVEIQNLKNVSNYKTKYDIKNHYHNLRYSIIKQINLQHLENSCLRLIALSEYFRLNFNDGSLVEKVYIFVQKMINQKKVYNIRIKSEIEVLEKENNDMDFRKAWPKEFLCEDGHYVRSVSEVFIDNWLYHHNIIHVYEKKCHLPLNPNTLIISDFYIKEIDTYIEYWGKYDKKYIDRKQAKRELYRRNNIKLIELEYEHLKRLDDVLIKLIKKGD